MNFVKSSIKPMKSVIPQELKNVLRQSVSSNPQDQHGQYQEILKQVTPNNMYKSIDSSFEGFFYQREYNIKNFNFLIKVLGEQKKLEEAEDILEKMKIFKIQPNVVTYNYMIKACGKMQSVKNAEKYFEKAIKKFGPNKYLYNTLISVYTRAHKNLEVDKIIREMRKAGIQPDVPVITTQINAHYKARKLQNCWNIWNEIEKNPNSISGKPDTNLISLMVEIASHTHEAEKAIQLNKRLEDRSDFMHTTTTFNAIIKALASRRDYASQALDYFEKMKYSDANMDMDTYVHTLKACSQIGEVTTAFNILSIMKEAKIKPNQYIYNQIIKTYAGACRHVPIEESTKDLYIKDAWKLLEQIKGLGFLNINTLNSFLTIFVKANRPDELEGLVLPLYDKYNIQMDQYTYQHVLELYHEHRDLQTVYRVFSNLNEKNIEKTWWTLNYVLDSAIRAEDADVIVKILKEFQKQNREPRIVYLKRLGESDYLPDKIYAELQKFSKQFGKADKKTPLNKQKKQIRDAWR